MQARAAWWAEWNALDKQMQELLENIEFCWLCFQGMHCSTGVKLCSNLNIYTFADDSESPCQPISGCDP